MDIEYTGRQTVITKKLKTQSETGLARIAKMISRTASAHVFLTADKYRRIAEVTLKSRGQDLVATCEGSEMEAALHDALCKLEQQVVRLNKKRTTGKRHPKTGVKGAELEQAPGKPVKAILKKKVSAASAAAKNGTKNGAGSNAVAMVVHSFPSRSPLIEPHVVRTVDSSAMRPMSLEEAVKEAAFRDREVFVFRDHEGQAAVLHRKRDGKVELIQIPL